MFRWYYSRFLRRLIKMSVWSVAIRETHKKYLFNEEVEQYEVIPNTDMYWFADPILHKKDGKTWLFVEAFNREKHKGEIGVFCVSSGKCKDYKTIISTDYHMSFPYVFEYNGETYLIPETGANRTIDIYCATSFPYKWEKKGTLLSGNAYRDSTVFFCNDEIYLYTYLRTDNSRLFHTYKCALYKINMYNYSVIQIEEYKDINANRRSAGPVFIENSKMIHVTQKCDKYYGEAIVFWKSEVEQFSWRELKPYRVIYGENVRIHNIGHPSVLHTYSMTNEYEAIDFRTREKSRCFGYLYENESKGNANMNH